jgi:hypothetical protein
MTVHALSEEHRWERRRAVLAFLEIARDALQTVRAITDEDGPIAEPVYQAQKATLAALQVASATLAVHPIDTDRAGK